MATLSYPSSESLIDKAKGRSLTAITKQGIGGWLLAVSSSSIIGTQTLTEFLLFPFLKVMEITDSTVDAFILKPLVVIVSGSQATAQSVAEFELFGLPLGTAIVLFTLMIVAWYLRRESTSDAFVGTFTDFGGGLIGTEEEDEE